MSSADLRKRYEGGEQTILQNARSAGGGYSTHAGNPLSDSASDKSRPEFNLLVAGCRGGKTSFLRLLLDTSAVSQRASNDQLASVAKFVQGCSGHTAHIRSTAVDVDVDLDGITQPLCLTLVDTPSIDFRDENSAERLLSEILRHIDSRFAEGIEDEWKAQSGDRYVHLCIYFLDPDQILPPPVPSPPVPVISRARANSFSQTEHEPVILEPPVTTNPFLSRPTLPASDIMTIRRLSQRVNVLPVIARADVLCNDRLSAIKLAIRRDLADSGIGFGIFDVDGAYHQQHDEMPSAKNGDSSNGHPSYSMTQNGSVSSTNSPPPSPATPSLLRLPYALISPDIYSHSDGVPRVAPSRHELVLQYSPSYHQLPPFQIKRGKYVRSYRWGSLDVLDPMHCDFVTLRNAIFHHMETLQKYTREYLFDKFKLEYLRQQHPKSRHSLSQSLIPQALPSLGPPPVPQNSRPILAIDTASHGSISRRSSLTVPFDINVDSDIRPSSASSRTIPDSTLVSTVSSKIGPSKPSPSCRSSFTPPIYRFMHAGSAKQRSKKITVACNFCRSRKLKCDGGRPACSQCVKRQHSCDYQSSGKRRGTLRQRRDDDSESDSGGDRTPDHDPSLSPEIIPQQTPSRKGSMIDQYPHEGFRSSLSSLGGSNDPGPSSSRSRLSGGGGEPRSFFADNELPHIATLSLPAPSPSATPAPMSAPSLPPIRPASDTQAAQRKRAATVPGKSNRQPSTSGPKIVACNFCRARKTKCDGGQPACSSCARRSLPCNYAHDHGDRTFRKGGRRATMGSKMPTASDSLSSPPSSRMVPTPASSEVFELEMKRPLEYSGLDRPLKKMRTSESSSPIHDVP